jgi:hypothetical protein
VEGSVICTQFARQECFETPGAMSDVWRPEESRNEGRLWKKVGKFARYELSRNDKPLYNVPCVVLGRAVSFNNKTSSFF